jgi:hypothetical protein
MASEILGRTPCPIKCGHDAAHVKRKTDKSTGRAYAYVHCRGCGCQLHAKNEEQENALLAITRKEALDIPAAPAPAPAATPKPAPIPAPTPAAPAAAKLAGWW